ELDGRARHQIDLIRTTAQQGAALTGQLLAFSRKQVATPCLLDVNAAVTRMEQLLHRLLGEDLALRIVLDRTVGQVKADPGQLDQVLMNLVVNARDAMPHGGHLTVETASVTVDDAYAQQHLGVTPGPYVMVAVSDTGCGMDRETLSHIFEPFFTTKGEDQGTGLGLATVYGIVQQCGGHIWVYSEPGRGTTFKIYFPRVDESGQREPARPAAPAARGEETVLLVEAEPMVRELVRDALMLQGYSVIEASHANEALLIGRQYDRHVHLLITDVVMPGMSGRELAEHLVGMRPEMKVLFISGYTDDAVV